MKTPNKNNVNEARRNILFGATAVASVVASNSVFSATDHKHHQMNRNTGLIDTAMDCIKTGQACNDHCIELVKSGDTSIADCMSTVSEMLAACTALLQLASYQSRHLPAIAKVCIDVCNDCEKECRKHEDKHVECKACANSCLDCIEACKKIAA